MLCEVGYTTLFITLTLVELLIIYLVYTPIVFPIELQDKDFPIFHSLYFMASRAYTA